MVTTGSLQVPVAERCVLLLLACSGGGRVLRLESIQLGRHALVLVHHNIVLRVPQVYALQPRVSSFRELKSSFGCMLSFSILLLLVLTALAWQAPACNPPRAATALSFDPHLKRSISSQPSTVAAQLCGSCHIIHVCLIPCNPIDEAGSCSVAALPSVGSASHKPCCHPFSHSSPCCDTFTYATHHAWPWAAATTVTVPS